MLNLLVGKKGSGKTKTLIAEVNKASETSNGVVVCIEYGKSLTFDVKYHARLVDALEYSIQDADALYGFVSGMLAANYDVTDIFIDNGIKLCGGEAADFFDFIRKLGKVIANNNVNCLVSASIDPDELPADIKDLVRTND